MSDLMRFSFKLTSKNMLHKIVNFEPDFLVKSEVMMVLGRF